MLAWLFMWMLSEDLEVLTVSPLLSCLPSPQSLFIILEITQLRLTLNPPLDPTRQGTGTTHQDRLNEASLLSDQQADTREFRSLDALAPAEYLTQ